VAKPSNEGPAAWVLDAGQKRQGQLHDLLELLLTQGVLATCHVITREVPHSARNLADFRGQTWLVVGGSEGIGGSAARSAVAAGARNFDGAIDADQPEHERRIGNWARLVLPRFAAERDA